MILSRTPSNASKSIFPQAYSSPIPSPTPPLQSILAGELLLQILIVQFGGQWFHTHPLNATEWAVCVGLGATTLGLREILRRVPYGR